MQPKTKKTYQFSIINENFEHGEHETSDPVFYNVHHEFFNDDYDKSYDDYQNYGDKISDNIMGGADVNFINPLTPWAKFKLKHTCDRCRSSFDFRNRLFAPLRLDCWNNVKSDAMTADVVSLQVIIFPATAVENTGVMG